MGELSVFVDESGDFGPSSEYYLVNLVLHDQSADVRHRIKEFARFFAFATHVSAMYQSFLVVKREHRGRLELKAALTKEMSGFVKDNLPYFTGFDKAIVYYDNGQSEITDLLNTLFNALLSNVEFRKVLPDAYRLFQTADLYCTLELERAKFDNNELSDIELYFFGGRRRLKKDYLNKLDRKQFKAS